MTSGQGDLRIILLGKTGAGKSATGNTILGRNAFKETSNICEKQKGYVDGKNIVVFDTPGLFNPSMTKEQVKAEIERSVEMSAPGPHVFLLVIKLGVRFTAEERNSVQWIQDNFGKEALLRTIILFTHTDLLDGKSLEEYIRKSHYLPKIVDSCGGRYHSVNNEDRNNQHQITELLQKINALRENGIKHYTPEMFKTIQTEITGKGGMKPLNITHILSIIVVIGVIFLGTQQWNNRLQNAIKHIGKEMEQLINKIEDNKQEEKRLSNELSLNEKDEKNQKNKLYKIEDAEKQLRQNLSQNVEDKNDLKYKLQEMEKEEKQLRNKLPQKEQEEVWLKNELQTEEEQLQQENKLQQAEKEYQLERQLLQKEQEKNQQKHKLLDKTKEEFELIKELLKINQEKHKIIMELNQKEQKKQKLQKELQQKEHENQNLEKELQQKKNEKQQLENKLLQNKQTVQ